MDNEELKTQIINEYCSLSKEEEGLSIYELKTIQKQKDEENKIQILSIGPENSEPIKSVLLMGETGAGKTRIINAMVNHLYGVTFEDTYRFFFKDQLEYNDKNPTESQTDYITAYIIYHQNGMLGKSNYMLIDTPGFGDTRSEYHQKLAMDHLRTFLTEDYGIDDLNCIGLVAKANQNRISGFQRVILSEFTSLLGSNVSLITYLLATFASDDTQVDEVVRQEEVEFVSMYEFDNWPLYVPHNPSSSNSKRDHKNYRKFRWENMQIEYVRFFETLENSSPVSLRRTREVIQEIKLLEEIKMTLKYDVMNVSHLITSLNEQKRVRHQYAEQASKMKWKTKERKKHLERYEVDKGFHAHNCDICRKTCISLCADPSNVTAALAGTGTGVGAAAVAGVGSAVTTGAVIGAEVGTFGGPLGVLIGGGIGTAVGLTAGLIVGITTRKTSSECYIASNGSICNTDGCNHKISDHTIEKEKIVIDHSYDEKIDLLVKSRYDDAIKEIGKIEKSIEEEEKIMNEFKDKLTLIAKALVEHTSKISELSYGYKNLNPQAIIDEMIMEERENCQHVELLKVLRSAVRILSERREQNGHRNSTRLNIPANVCYSVKETDELL
ncbi:uncharacterized protein LOC135208467 [Macrobrachium nipponense]|uniref:uncharacterized protein LOC135208467 n=1 Tax=Macrobrachium nipponense TaxID=159736 RepID=UPI0030C7C6A6